MWTYESSFRFLGLKGSTYVFQMAVFCPNKTSSPPDRRSSREEFPVESRLHCLLLLLRKENAGHHVPALVKGNASLT